MARIADFFFRERTAKCHEAVVDRFRGSSTDGAARYTGGITALSFMKAISVQSIDDAAAARLGPAAAALARQALGQRDEGLASVREALTALESTSEGFWHADLRRLEGLLLAEKQQYVAAAFFHFRAFLVDPVQGNHSAVSHTATSYPRWLACN